MRICFGIAAAALAVAAIVAVRGGLQNDQGTHRWKASDPAYVPFDVHRITLSPDNRFAAVQVDERERAIPGVHSFAAYLIDLETGDHQRVGDYGLVPVSESHVFLRYDIASSSEKFLLFDGLKQTDAFDVGEHDWVWWNRGANRVMFDSEPGRKTEGFDQLGILDISTGRVSRVKLRGSTEEVAFCVATGHFFTPHWYPELPRAETGVDEYDAEGNFIRSSKSPLAVFSARCRYALPFSAIGRHGPDDWAVYDALSGKRLMNFPWDESGKTDQHWFESWNPTHDHLLLMHSAKAGRGATTTDMVDVRQRRIVKSWPGEPGDPPLVWSGDGNSVVTVRDRRIIFEPIQDLK
jgi:hypothetical protein